MIVLIKSRARAAALLAEWAERVARAPRPRPPPRRSGPSASRSAPASASARRVGAAFCYPASRTGFSPPPPGRTCSGPGRPAPQARRPLRPDAHVGIARADGGLARGERARRGVGADRPLRPLGRLLRRGAPVVVHVRAWPADDLRGGPRGLIGGEPAGAGGAAGARRAGNAGARARAAAAALATGFARRPRRLRHLFS